MGKPEFEARFGFLPIFDTKKQKRRSIAKHLASDQAYLDKHGFILIEAPELIAPPVIEPKTETKIKRGRKPKKQENGN